ncbi:MAG TPA: hypothetical protein VM735_00595 [Candidatus Kapabacteria bacterium]|nr:hypothetical protein [Candidatus Kapabacteria bacterium]
MIRRLVAIACVGMVFISTGCSTCKQSAGRQFRIAEDNLSFANQLKWTYEFREDGSFIAHDVEPAPERPHRCFPMARATREFFYHARFDPTLPKEDENGYRKLVSEVLSRNSRCPSSPEERIVIPGYTNLFSFSTEHSELVRSEIGGSWRSFYQRGNWRMIFPISDRRERKTAHALFDEVQSGRTPIVHVYRFPDVRLNHGLLVFEAKKEGNEMVFYLYDPNNTTRRGELRFNESKQSFIFERNQYFAGGPVKVYEVYRGLFY